MKKWFGYGGIAASVVLIAFGVGARVVGVGGYNMVRDEITAQQITATPDAAELSGGVLAPGQAIRTGAQARAVADGMGDHTLAPGRASRTGAQARAFADVMEHHTLAATQGKRYAEMGRFLTPAGKDTNDEALAAKDAHGQPVENGLRDMGVGGAGV